MIARQVPLGAYALFAALLASAGLPIYMHAPKFYVDTYGVGLPALGVVLFGLRLVDVVQDPLLGMLAGRLRHRGFAAAVAAALLAAAMVGLFAVSPPVAPLLWFALTLALLFSAFSFLTILFYATGVQRAQDVQGSHLRLAAWRETGGLIGICLSAVAPVALGAWLSQPFAGFAVGFVVLAAVATIAMRAEWQAAGARPETGFRALRPVLTDGPARRLLLVALMNAAPVAVSSTLFLFFVDARLSAAGSEGPLLLLFFASAALAAPIWSALAHKFGAKKMLLTAMGLSIVAFAGAVTLQAGDVALFAVICAASGAAVGADMTLLPALFAHRMAQIVPEASIGFGLWSLVNKAALAVAAIALLPLLGAFGFQSGSENTETALWALTVLYAALPCVLKACAALLLMVTSLEDIQDV